MASSSFPNKNLHSLRYHGQASLQTRVSGHGKVTWSNATYIHEERGGQGGSGWLGGGCIHPVGAPESLDQPRKRPESRAIDEDGRTREQREQRSERKGERERFAGPWVCLTLLAAM